MNKTVRKALLATGLYDPIVDFKNWLVGSERKYINFYSQFVNKGDLCFDIGANMGRRAKVLLKLGARVIVVEPQQHCMESLKKKFENKKNITLLQKAVGQKEGHAEMMICNTHSLSSLSREWVDSVKQSGRYTSSQWEKTVTVPVTTLDALISQYGKPEFIKVDVEGYELEALNGLSQPVDIICFEFTPEFIKSTIKCVDRVEEIGKSSFNYCYSDEPFNFVLSQWIDNQQMYKELELAAKEMKTGDVYVKFMT